MADVRDLGLPRGRAETCAVQHAHDLQAFCGADALGGFKPGMRRKRRGVRGQKAGLRVGRPGFSPGDDRKDRPALPSGDGRQGRGDQRPDTLPFPKVGEHLWRERLLIAVPKAHPLAQLDVIGLEDLRGERLLVSAGDVGRPTFNLWGDKLALDIVVQEVGAAVLLEQARMGLGVTVLGSASLKSLRPDPDLVIRPLAFDPDPPLVVAATWSARNDNPALRRFVSDTIRSSRPTSSSQPPPSSVNRSRSTAPPSAS